jgi:hypothetical protein
VIRDDFVERRFVDLALPVDLGNRDRATLNQMLDCLWRSTNVLSGLG